MPPADPSAVKAAYSSGKPALGVGAGNTPVYLEKTADLNTAVVDIIVSKTFDNGTICASEQTAVIDDEVFDSVLEKFAELGAHICSEKETRLLEHTVIDPDTGFMQPMAVGQKATDIARFAGISVEPSTRLLIAEIRGVGREHPLSVEKLFPVLSVYRAKSSDEALRLCVDVNQAGESGIPQSFLAQRGSHPEVRRGHECRPDHRELPRYVRSSRWRVQRSGTHFLVRLWHWWRQQHHR